MTTTGSSRKRPHPARRARTLAGALSVAGLLALTAGMAAAGTAAATTTRSKNAAVVAATTSTSSAAADTSTHAS